MGARMREPDFRKILTGVEHNLPSRFLLQLGIFVATFSQIEFAAWRIVLSTLPRGAASPTGKEHPFEYKLSTTKLVKGLKSAHKPLPVGLGLRVLLLSERLELLIPARNAAVHGAFFVSPGTVGYGVAHYSATGSGENRQFFQFQNEISQTEIDDAIDFSDVLLSESMNIADLAETWRKRQDGASYVPPFG